MKLSELDFEFPPSLVAQRPLEKRDASRLMHVCRSSKELKHHHFSDLPKILKKGDLLIVNDSRVIPARLFGKRKTGGEHEILLLRPIDNKTNGKVWEAIAGNMKKIKAGVEIDFGKNLSARCLEKKDGSIIIEFNEEGEALESLITALGQMPLPPYIERKPDASDAERYQTVYAKKTGSVAAPTAGLHFTEKLLNELSDAGIKTASVTLHVSADTFLPVRTSELEGHEIHGESVCIGKDCADQINDAKRSGRRVIAVGTTSARAIESGADCNGCKAGEKFTKLFITPGYKFKLVDAMITNFHRPRSTLLAMIMAFAGKEFILDAYQRAIEEKYRLFSYGDAMFIS